MSARRRRHVGDDGGDVDEPHSRMSRAESKCHEREIGSECVWTVSSCKQGLGVANIKDQSAETYWQSDGQQPHSVTLEFNKKTTISSLSILANVETDESYTPNLISIKCGTDLQDLQELMQVELGEIKDWRTFQFTGRDGGYLRTYVIQITVHSNHMNGRDTHLRGIRINSPVEHRSFAMFDRL
eukprot:m.63028 g.63028  ORF g.63028 m.63028 type:complete len:184 (-) comp11938_c0_seq1:2790-3341(-)